MQSKSITFACIVFVALLIGATAIAEHNKAGATAKAEKKEAGPTLYERLGGVYNIAAVVDDLIERLYVNDTLNAVPAIDKARNPVRKPGVKFQLTALMCQVTGGPEKYTGRSMKETHINLKISEKEWKAMAADFKATLDKFKVPEKEQSELFAIVESTKPDIVTIRK